MGTRLKEFIENLENIEPLPPNLHEKLLTYFKEYLSMDARKLGPFRAEMNRAF